MWCWWRIYLIFFYLKKRLFRKMKLLYAKTKLCRKNSHMLGLFQIKMFTSPNQETQRYWNVGACSKRHFTDSIRVLSLLSKSWNMNSCTHLLSVSLSMSAAQIELQVHFGGISIKEEPEGQRSFSLYCTQSVIFPILRPCTALQRLTTLFTFHIANMFFKFI